MEITNERMSKWNGYDRLDFEFEGRACRVIFPEEGKKNRKWLLKTEYADAFPAFELEMLARGYHVAYVANVTRWMVPSDIEAKAHFADLLSERYGLEKKCVPVGMSCGGLQAVYFAAKHPEYIAALYLDAPVMNLLSCPCYVGRCKNSDSVEMSTEFTKATGITVSELINYRNHPIDVAPALVENEIPLILVSGDSDTVVPFHENGRLLAELYEKGGAPIEVHIKPGGDHHPHSLPDNTPIVEFVEKWYK